MTVAELVAKIVFKSDPKPLKDLRKGLESAGSRLQSFRDQLERTQRVGVFRLQKSLISLTNRLDKMAERTRRVRERVDKLQSAMSDLGTPLKGAAAGMAAVGAAAVAAAGSVLAFVNHVATSGDEVAKTAAKFGVSVEELQRLRFAADRSGASTEVMTQAIREQAKLIDEARQGAVTPFTMALDRVGLSLADLEGATGTEERFGIIADALRGVTDGGERTALSMKLLGEEVGPQLVPLLSEGSAGIRALGAEAERLGLVMSEDAAKASEGFVDTMTNLRARLTGIVNTIGTKLMPLVQEPLERFGAWIDANGDAIASTLGAAFEALADALTFLSENVWVLKTLGVLLGVLTAAVTVLTAASAVLGTTMLVAFSPVLAPILAITAAIAALVGAWAAWGPSFAETRDFVIEGLNFIIDRIQELVNWLGIAADFSGLQISTARGDSGARSPAQATAQAASRQQRENDEFDALLRDTMIFQRQEQARQIKQKQIQDREKGKTSGGRATPDPFTQKHRSTIESQLKELALAAGEAEFARSRDAKAAARVSRDTLRELQQQAKRGNLPERRDFQREQEERNREFIEQQARAAGERVLLAGAAAADRAANETRARLERAGATAPTRPQGLFDALGIGGLGPSSAAPEARVQASARVVNFRIDVRQDIDNAFHIEGNAVDTEGLFARIERRLGDIMDRATRGALLDVRDQIEA